MDRTYVVMRGRDDEGRELSIVGSVDASSAEQAIKQMQEALDETSSTWPWAATPERNLLVVKPTVVTSAPRVSFEKLGLPDNVRVLRRAVVEPAGDVA